MKSRGPEETAARWFFLRKALTASPRVAPKRFLKGIAGRLSVIGEEDQFIVGAGGMPQHAHDFAEPFVDVLEVFQGRPGVRSEMVGQLVVAAVGGVDAGTPA